MPGSATVSAAPLGVSLTGAQRCIAGVLGGDEHGRRDTRAPRALKGSWSRFTLVLLAALLASCATSTIESRRNERLAAYGALSVEHRQLVDQGQIKVGMSPDAVYIAWGQPTEILEQENQQSHTTIWIYHGQWLEESRYWTYREVSREGSTFLERRLESDYFPRSYIRAEIFFANGAVLRWQTLPRPAY